MQLRGIKYEKAVQISPFCPLLGIHTCALVANPGRLHSRHAPLERTWISKRWFSTCSALRTGAACSRSCRVEHVKSQLDLAEYDNRQHRPRLLSLGQNSNVCARIGQKGDIRIEALLRTCKLPQTIHHCSLWAPLARFGRGDGRRTGERFRVSPLFMFSSCGNCALSFCMTRFAPHRSCESHFALVVGRGWTNEDRNMLFCFVRDKLRTVQGRRFQLNQLDLANRFCRSPGSAERPTHRTRTWGSRRFAKDPRPGCILTTPCHRKGLDKNVVPCRIEESRMAAAARTADWSIASRNSCTNGKPDRVSCILWSTRSAQTTRKFGSLRNRGDGLLDRRKRRRPILCIHRQPHVWR